MKDVLNLGQLVLTAASGVPHAPSNLPRGINNEGDEQQQQPCQPSAENNHDRGGENKREQLLQEFRQYGGHGKLHALYVIHDRGNQSAGGMLLKERR